MNNESLKTIYKQRLINLIDRRGDDAVFELSMQIIEGIESDYNIKLTREQVSMLEEIVEEYKGTGLIL